ncbi:MAG TPA: hemolysin family protein [Fimbriiglobus sp.]|jgi:CBS domain containing-hemolysin-like protein
MLFSEFDLQMVLGLLAIPALVAVNGFFVSAEFALVAVRKTRVEELVNRGTPGAKALMAAIERIHDSVAASQLGITIASLALGFVSEPAVARLLYPLFERLPAHWQGTVVHVLSVTVTLSLVTYLHVVFGEQMPKLAALQSAEGIGLWIARPINVFASIARPVVRLMNGTSTFFLRRLGYEPDADEGEVHSIEELRLLIEDTEEAGLIDPEQADVVLNVFGLTQKKVRACMVPREKMITLDVRATRDQVLTAIREGAHTRMPVWEDRPDNVIGIVNSKELLYLFTANAPVVLDDLLYPATFLDPDMSISDALHLLRKTHKHLALVRDRTEVVLGMITLEDVLEEIVGDIEDEHDVRQAKLIRRKRPPKKT